MHLVTRRHFCSRDKDGGHTIRSVIVKNPMLRLMALYVLKNRSYGRSKFYIAGIGIFYLICSCDLDLDPMTFMYDLYPCSLEIHRICKYELPTSRLSNIVWQTDRHDRNYIPRRFVGGKKCSLCLGACLIGWSALLTCRFGVDFGRQLSINLLSVRRVLLRYNWRTIICFCWPEAMEWNSLPDDVTSASSLTVFLWKLKTHFCRQSYPDNIM